VTLRLHVLGGWGSFGSHALLLEDLSSGDVVMVDAGAGFPRESGSGGEISIPDPACLLPFRGRLRGYLLTHGHDDHAGAVSFLHRACPAPCWGTATTLALVRERCAESGVDIPGLEPLEPGRTMGIGSFRVTPFHVSHSIPGTVALALEGGGVRVLHAADFRADQDPLVGPPTDLTGLAALGDQGVDLLLLDSTGALHPGHNPGERSLRPALERAVATTPGRVFLTTFASHVQRVALAAEVFSQHGRRLHLAGRGVLRHTRVARALGNAPWPEGCVMHPSDASGCPPGRLGVVLSGCQGEERSAFSRLATGGEAGLPPVAPGDTVIHSARVIPGCETRVADLLDALARRGARVLDAADGMHVSGHGHQEDLRALLRATRPRAVIPIHGGHRHLHATARLARAEGWAEELSPTFATGDVVDLSPHGVPTRVGSRPVPTLLVDEDGTCAPQPPVAQERRDLRQGVVLVTVVVDAATGALLAEGPWVDCRGLAPAAREEMTAAATRGRLGREVMTLSEDDRRSASRVEQALTRGVGRILRRQGGDGPLVVARALVR
jgi:ribonuclease J